MLWPALMVTPFALVVKKERAQGHVLQRKRLLTVSFAIDLLQSNRLRYQHHHTSLRRRKGKLSVLIIPPPPPSEDSTLVDPSSVSVIGAVGDASVDKSLKGGRYTRKQ